MQTYSEWRPCQFDTKGLNLADNQDWFVAPVIKTRDSNPLEESNFESALKLFGGESDTVQVCHFGHWACGWFDIILVHPKHQVEIQAMEKKLEDYPILNEDDLGEREEKAAQETWIECYSLKERIELCNRAGVSIFAARHDYFPSDDQGYIKEKLLGH